MFKMERIQRDETIQVVFICDENYVMPTVVAITSIYTNKSSSSVYCIHVIGSDLSETSRQLFAELNQEDFLVQIVDVQQTKEFEELSIKNLHVSTAALYKFNIANLFPHLDKLLYLDGDMLIQRGLESLYSVDISDVYAAVVKDYKPMTYNPTQVEKLKINHSAYFNSGVMLLNLKKFRKDDLFHKLLDYRTHGINFFMDQDALNVVFQEKVKYLPLYYNVMSSVMGFFTLDDLVSYYGLADIHSKEEIYEKASIVHLCTKYKPWKYSNVPFAGEWYRYYKLSPIKDALCRDVLDQVDFKTFKDFDLNAQSLLVRPKLKVIVSLTSFPARIHTVSLTIRSLLEQSYKDMQVILWLAKEQFPHLEQDLPKELIQLLECKEFSIRWCDDLRPHKKYFYAMQEFPDNPIITVDDDAIYSSNTVQQLVESYCQFPFAVSALRVHRIRLTEEGEIAPYRYWEREIKNVGVPSLALCATGISGILYPPHILPKETFNKERIKELCLNADDLWLKTMELINNVPVVLAASVAKPEEIPTSQDVALWRENDKNGANDYQLQKLIAVYNNWCGAQDTLLYRLSLSTNTFHKLIKTSDSSRNKQADKLVKRYKKELNALQNSTSYRIGRAITFLPRKIRGGIRCYKENGFKYTIHRLGQKLKLVK